MRSGSTIATVDRAEATIEQLVTLMTGNAVSEASSARAARPAAESRPVLVASGVALAPEAEPIDLELRSGEIIGIAGLEGHGQESLLLALWGGRVERGEVRRVDGERSHALRSHRQAARRGVAYVPRDRRKASIFPSLPIIENFAVTTLAADSRGGLLSAKSRQRRFDRYRERLGIRLGRPDDAITTLSGGNQQKVILARWLATEPEVLLLNDPTRGIDVGAKHDIYGLLRESADAGSAVVLLSSELEEHLTLVDRVLVMREHGVFASFRGDEITREALVSAFFGVGKEPRE
jgi:ABC-type sugar transport system ATPase subunit